MTRVLKVKGLSMLLILFFFSGQVFAQGKQITGKVTSSENKQPVSGITVTAKGTNIATTTDNDGYFKINLPNNSSTLVFSGVSFATQEISTSGKSTINVELVVSTKGLDEVVVIGYGTVKRRDLTGSVISIKGAEIREIPAQNPLESIQGKVAGVDIQRSSGSASSGLSIRVRGNRSIGAGNSPLFIVDGIQTGNIDDINPNSIESVEFLKDASATAIYGWQGANGIIIITTKKGSGGKTKIDFNSYLGISTVSRYPSVLTGPEYAEIRREAKRTVGAWNSSADDAIIFTAAEFAAIQNNQWIDYQDLLFHKGIQQNHNIGVSTGNDKTKVYFGIDYLREKGILKFDEVKRYSIRTNIDQTFNSWIKAGLQSQITNRDESYRRDPLNIANKIIPFGTVYDANGNFILNPANGNTVSALADEQPNVFNNTGKITSVITNVYLDMKPFSGFTFRSNFGVNIGNSRSGLFEAQQSISRATATGSFASYNASNSRFLNWDNIITYQTNIKSHSFTLTGLNSYVESLSDNVSAQGEGQLLPSQLFYALGNAPNNIKISSGYTKWNVLSFAGRLNYSYKGKYLITITNRVDGASRLSVGNKWASFPSASVAWRIVDENFMKKVSFVSDLKLRLSYGVAGNSGISPYGTQSSLLRVPMAFGETSFQGFTFSPLLGNADAGWELSKTKNIGIDFGLLNNRVNATVDIYDTHTSDLLLPRGLPPTTGVQTVYQNIGETRNRGYDISLSSTNVKTKDFTWSSSLTYSHNKEEIVSLVTNGVNDIGNGWFIGQPINVFYDYEKLGIWQTSEAADALVFGQKPGDIKVKDQNEDNKIDAINDRVVLGGVNRPKWHGGFDNKVTYKGFDISIYIYARWGQMLNPNFLNRYDRQSNLSNSTKIINYWTPTNPSNDYPRPNANISGASTLYFSTIGYVDGSYLRIRNMSLGYTFPTIKKAFFNSLRVYVNGTNLATWTKSAKLKEYDPERGGGESAPMLKNVVFGINFGL